MGLKKKLAQRKLNKIAQNISRSVIMPDISTAKLVGVLWQPSQKEAFMYLKEYFTREHIIFRGFCVFDDLVNPQTDSTTVSTSDLNWIGLPKPEKIDDFIQTEFDILFNTSLTPNLALNYITLLSKAKFKVGGSSNEINIFDLNINIGKKDDTMYLAKQQIFYLAQLNKTRGK